MAGAYDPFAPGPFAVGVRSIQARDSARDRLFPCDVWYPEMAEPGGNPLILYSHHSGGNRRAATYLCSHLCSHGYVVAALDHSEIVDPELSLEARVANRVPDMRFLLDYMLSTESGTDPGRVGIVGHSFGGWTALAAPEVEPRIRAVVALAPGGASNPRPGIIRAELAFGWGRDVPTLYLVAENDVPLPLEGMYQLFQRTQSTEAMLKENEEASRFLTGDIEGELRTRGIEVIAHSGPLPAHARAPSVV